MTTDTGISTYTISTQRGYQFSSIKAYGQQLRQMNCLISYVVSLWQNGQYIIKSVSSPQEGLRKHRKRFSYRPIRHCGRDRFVFQNLHFFKTQTI